MARKRTKGEGEVYKEPGRQWAVRWREGGRRRYRGGFDSKALADRVLARIRGELAVQRSGLPADPRAVPTLGELATDWLERRDLTHKAAAEDRSRWKKHVKPWFGRRRPAEVDAAAIRAFAEAKLGEGLAAGTVRILVALLSSLYVDLVERGLATSNPARGLPRATMRLLKSTHDPRTTPFLERLDDVRRVFLALDGSLAVGFALGALGGLRPGEAFALRWEHVDLARGVMHIRESVTGSLKDKDSRVVPILDPLAPVLKAQQLATGGRGLLCPAMRVDGARVNKGTRGPALAAVLEQLGLTRPGLGWYECTRHTFASQWVMAGRSIEELKEILGHYSVVVTERYAHLRPDLFAEGARSALKVNLTPGAATVPAQIGQPRASAATRKIRKRTPD